MLGINICEQERVIKQGRTQKGDELNGSPKEGISWLHGELKMGCTFQIHLRGARCQDFTIHLVSHWMWCAPGRWCDLGWSCFLYLGQTTKGNNSQGLYPQSPPSSWGNKHFFPERFCSISHQLPSYLKFSSYFYMSFFISIVNS